jgi:hypothetical protein
LGCMYIGSEKPKPALHTSVYPWFIACLYANFYLVIFPRKMFKLTDAVSLVLGAASWVCSQVLKLYVIMFYFHHNNAKSLTR